MFSFSNTKNSTNKVKIVLYYPINHPKQLNIFFIKRFY